MDFQRFVIRQLAVFGEFFGNCCTILVVCVNKVVNPHLTTVRCECYPIQALVQLCIIPVCIIVSCTIAFLMRQRQLGTLSNVAFDHNVYDIATICIDTGRVVHITVCIETQVACNLAFDTVRLIHLDTETLCIVAAPSICNLPQTVVCIIVSVRTVSRCYCCFSPVITTDLFHHLSESCWQCLIICICIQLLIAHTCTCICVFQLTASFVGENCTQRCTHHLNR